MQNHSTHKSAAGFTLTSYTRNQHNSLAHPTTSIGGNIGNQVMVKDPRPFSIKDVALFKYYDKTAISPLFLKLYVENLANGLQEKASGGAQPFISLGALRKLVFAIPPVPEQRRIVAKVKELMTLCDRLMERLGEAQTIQTHLADAIVEQAFA